MDVYLDNAATTYPKPKQVLDSMYNYMLNIGGNANRGTYSNSIATNKYLFNARSVICDFFGFNSPGNVIFTNNVTTSLNILIKGILKPGDHAITSSMEHNSVLRPLEYCKTNLNIDFDIINANNNGFINISDLEKSIKSNTKLIILTHASNVTGSIQKIYEVGQLCKKHNIMFLLDSSQGAGVLNINMKELNINALAFTGHKSLLGPQGIGGFIIDDYYNNMCSSLLQGGTGSMSYSLDQPDFLPDKFESGTLNMPGIVGLSSAIEYINSIGINTIYEHNNYLLNYLLEGLLNIKDIKVYGDLTGKNITTCISITSKSMDTSELGYYLDTNGIKTRSGLHCSPLAHKTIGTFPNGTVRMSISNFTTKSELDYTLLVLNKISKNINIL